MTYKYKNWQPETIVKNLFIPWSQGTKKKKKMFSFFYIYLYCIFIYIYISLFVIKFTQGEILKDYIIIIIIYYYHYDHSGIFFHVFFVLFVVTRYILFFLLGREWRSWVQQKEKKKVAVFKVASEFNLWISIEATNIQDQVRFFLLLLQQLLMLLC